MIGTFIRSFHHILKCGENFSPIQVLCIRHTSAISGEIVCAKNKKGKDMLFFFQNVNANIDLQGALRCAEDKAAPILTQLFNKWGRCVSLNRYEELRNYGTQFIMLPTDFDEQYNKFTNQNKRILQPVFMKLLGTRNDISKVLFAFCENGNLFAWAAKYVCQFKTPLMVIYRLMLWKNTYPQLVSKLKRGAFPAYGSFSSVVELLSEFRHLRAEKRVNDIINTFNTEQKKLFKNNIDRLPLPIFNKFAVLSPKKRHNFIRKVSSMTDINEIIRLMSFAISSHFAWSKDSLMEYLQNVENLNYHLVLATDTSVLVEVKDYETIKKLAKTTNWCISKNKSYWNNYLRESKDTHQFVLFDFSKKEDDDLSIVGFTTSDNKGITHAHSFTNNDLMGNRDCEDIGYINVFGTTRRNANIYSVIADNDIPMSLVTKFTSKFPNWTKEEFFKVFREYFNEDDYVIYLLDDEKVVLSTKSFTSIYNLLGRNYSNKFSDGYSSNEHIFFLNFGKDVPLTQRFLYTIVIESSYNSAYKTTTKMYDEYSNQTKFKFNDVLAEYNLPYNIICRPDTITNRFIEATMSKDVETMIKYLGEDEIKKLLKSKRNSNIKQYFKRELETSLRHQLSTQLLDAIEANGYALDEIMNYQSIENMIVSLYADCGCLGSTFMQMNSLEEAIKAADTHNRDGLNSNQRSLYARIYILYRVINPYKDNATVLKLMMNKLFTRLSEYHYAYALTDKFIGMALSMFDFNDVNPITLQIVSSIFSNNISSGVDKLFELNITNAEMQKVILESAPSKYHSKIEKMWGIKKEEPKVKLSNIDASIKWSSISEPMWTAATTYTTTF